MTDKLLSQPCAQAVHTALTALHVVGACMHFTLPDSEGDLCVIVESRKAPGRIGIINHYSKQPPESYETVDAFAAAYNLSGETAAAIHE